MNSECLGAAETIALCRTRLFRFTDDLDAYIVVEALAARLRSGQAPRPSTMNALHGVLQAWQRGQPLELGAPAVALEEGIDLEAEWRRRRSHRKSQRPRRLPALAVIIVGAPRSGTSHLHHLLAYQRRFAWLGGSSCWAWPTYALASGDAPLLPGLPSDVFALDSKRLRIDPSIVVPSEAEDVMARAIPTYDHLRAHQYEVHTAHIQSAELLLDSVSHHMDHFKTNRVILKSPFNSFRIRQLEEIFGGAARFVHIHRDGYTASRSISENGFSYAFAGRRVSSTESWARFALAAEAGREHAQIHALRLEDLVEDPATCLRDLFAWLEVDDATLRLPAGRPPLRVNGPKAPHPLIEEVHRLVGRDD
ncbi:MAG TPA: sulfotransferase [Solirubrobacterales bacterium]|nr:sulfotransferase [Solirubrobacterales bacterium]